jgi:vancomycin resistance protein YoaR
MPSRSFLLPLILLTALMLTALILSASSAPASQPTASTPPPANLSSLARPTLLTLVVVAPEPVLEDGQVRVEYLRRSYPLKLTPEQITAIQAGEPGSAEPDPAETSLQELFRQIELRLPVDARFVQVRERWTARAQTGWKVDRATTKARLKAALQGGKSEVAVPVRLTPPRRTVRQLQASGVLKHVGSGNSAFVGSPDFRVQNIQVGSSKLSGLLIGRGEVFDFNRSVGRITSARGFVPGYVISGGTLSLEDGGGICQVSTTIFRAAYNAGMDIVERHGHSHQVSYYDPPGFEATVYAPNLNLRFRNDTAGALLIQASWNLKAQTLSFDFFGSERRDVSISEPHISRVRPARPPGFMPDPALKPGQAVRVDMPAQGMDVRIVRVIRGKGGQLRRDETRSRYRPWGGVFAVHPADPRLD